MNSTFIVNECPCRLMVTQGDDDRWIAWVFVDGQHEGRTFRVPGSFETYGQAADVARLLADYATSDGSAAHR